jgi:hypothetical protein
MTSLLETTYSDLAHFFGVTPVNKESGKNGKEDHDFLLLMELAPPPPQAPANTAIMTASLPDLLYLIVSISLSHPLE